MFKTETFIYMYWFYTSMKYIGFNLEEKFIDKLKIVSLITKKNRTDLIREGLEYVFDKYGDSIDKFDEYMKSIK